MFVRLVSYLNIVLLVLLNLKKIEKVEYTNLYILSFLFA